MSTAAPLARPGRREWLPAWLPVLLPTLYVGLVQALVFGVLAWPWLRPDVLWDRMADAPNHLARIYVMSAALRAGNLFPRWVPDLYLGYGYPLFNFYAPGFYYLAALLHQLGLTIYASFQWVAALGIVAGCAGTYFLARALTGGRRDAALLAVAIFALAPYPYFLSLYGRASVPEAMAVSLLPWLLLSARKAWLDGGLWPAALALLTAAVLLTHNIGALLYGGALALWLAALAFAERGNVPLHDGLRRAAGGAAAGVGLSAFFWLPVLAESGQVHLELGQRGILDYKGWLFDPLQLLRWPSLGAARTGSAPLDAVDRFLVALTGDYRNAPGRLDRWQVLMGIALAGLAAWHLLRGPTTRPARLLPFWIGVALVCWFCSTVWSRPLWEHLPLLASIQFPQRLYGLLALALALAAACAVAAAPPGTVRSWSTCATLTVLAGLVALGALRERPYLVGREPAHDVDGRNLVAREENWFGMGTTSGGEFLPKTVDWPPYASGRLDGPQIYDRAYPEAGWQAGLVRVLDGTAAATGIYQGPTWLAAEVASQTPATLGFHQLYFPGWRAYVDGAPVPVEPARATVAAPPPAPAQDTIDASLGFMVVQVPAGTHRVEVRFGPTPARRLGTTLSLATLGAASAWLLLRLRHRLPLPAARFPGGRESSAARAGIGTALAAGLLASCALVGEVTSTRAHASFPQSSARVALDVIEALQSGPADARTPAGSGNAAQPPFLEPQVMQVGAERRRWLYMHPTSEIAVRLRVPEGAYFQAGLALDPQTWDAPDGDGARFIVAVETTSGAAGTAGAAGRRTLLDEHLNPRARADQRRWQDRWIDLRPYAGQEVCLILRTEPATVPRYQWAGWANPQVVVWRAARPIPTTPHPW